MRERAIHLDEVDVEQVLPARVGQQGEGDEAVGQLLGGLEL